MKIFQRIAELFRTKNSCYCIMLKGEPFYVEGAINWLHWAKTQCPIILSNEVYPGREIQIAITIEMRACDYRFARSKSQALDRKFYRVSINGGPRDGKKKDVRTLKEARELLSQWSQASAVGRVRI